MKTLMITFALILSWAAGAQTVAPSLPTYQEPTHLDSTAELDQLMQATEKYVPLERKDLIKIDVVGAPALSSQSRVAQDGTVNIPMTGLVTVAGLSVTDAEEAVARSVQEKGLVLDPAVTIVVLESPGHVISIDGEVAKPGVYPAIGDAQLTGVGATPSSGVRTLSQLLSLAGGLKDTASGTVTLYRPSLAHPVAIPLGTDPNHQPYGALPVFSGDDVVVAHTGQAYVIGAVAKQGIVPIHNYSPTTVSQAVAIAGGIGFEADANDARLVHTEGTKRVMYSVSLRKIVQGKAADIALQNDDILYIPTNAAKAALKSGGASLVVSLAAALLYTH